MKEQKPVFCRLLGSSVCVVTHLPEGPPDVETHHVQPKEAGVEGKEDGERCKKEKFLVQLLVM